MPLRQVVEPRQRRTPSVGASRTGEAAQALRDRVEATVDRQRQSQGLRARQLRGCMVALPLKSRLLPGRDTLGRNRPFQPCRARLAAREVAFLPPGNAPSLSLPPETGARGARTRISKGNGGARKRLDLAPSEPKGDQPKGNYGERHRDPSSTTGLPLAGSPPP